MTHITVEDMEEIQPTVHEISRLIEQGINVGRMIRSADMARHGPYRSMKIEIEGAYKPQSHNFVLTAGPLTDSLEGTLSVEADAKTRQLLAELKVLLYWADRMLGKEAARKEEAGEPEPEDEADEEDEEGQESPVCVYDEQWEKDWQWGAGLDTSPPPGTGGPDVL